MGTSEMARRNIIQQRTCQIARKSFESMLESQKRVDYLEYILRRKGLKLYEQKSECKRIIQGDASDPVYWLGREHNDRLMEEAKINYATDSKMREKSASGNILR